MRMQVLKACPSGPIMFSSGTRTLSKKIGTLGTPRMPILRSSLPKENPGVLVSTMKAEMPLAPLPSLVRANTRM